MLWLLFGSFALLCLLRVPIAFGMFIASTLTIWVAGDVPLSIVTQRVWVGLNNFPLLAVPFFLFVAQAMNETGTSNRLIEFSRAMVGWIRGGLAHVTVAVSMLFAGISGVSSAEALGVGSVMIPAMKREGYPTGFSVALVAASATLGNIIPPSLMMIVYAAAAGISVGAMFLSGIVPGVMIGLLQMVYAYRVASKNDIGDAEPFSMQRLNLSTRKAFLALLIPILIIGGILLGWFTATEASVVSVLYVMLLAVIYREFSFKRLYKLAEDSIGMFSLSLLCVAAASLWAWLLAFYSVPQGIVAWFGQVGLLSSQLSIFAVVVFVFLVVGSFMDAVPAIIILQPIIGEIGAAGGVDPYHMGIVIVLTLAIGLLTPPYGLCLLIAADLGGMSVAGAAKALGPFFVISLIVVAVAVFFPDLILWIPRAALASKMGGASP